MMNARRPYLATFALAFALATLAACGDKDPSPTPSPSETSDDADAGFTPAPGATSPYGVNPVGANKPPPDAGYFPGGSRLPQ